MKANFEGTSCKFISYQLIRIPSFHFCCGHVWPFWWLSMAQLRTLGALLLLKFFHLLAQLVHVRFLEGQRQNPNHLVVPIVVPLFSQFLLQPQNNIKNHTGSKCETPNPGYSVTRSRGTWTSKSCWSKLWNEAMAFWVFLAPSNPRAPRQVFSNKW